MEDAFERENGCGFYDPDVLPHGGPAPKNRQRREIDDDEMR